MSGYASALGGGAGGGVAISAGAASQSTGTITFSNANGVSFGLAGGVMTASVPAVGGAQTGISGLGGSNTTFSSGTVILSGSNNITIGTSVNGASQYLQLSVGNYLTTARASTDAIGLNTAGTNITWTANSSGLSLNLGGLAGTTSGTQSTAGSDIVMTHNSLGLNLGVPKYLTTAQSPGAYLTTARASNDAVGLNTAATNVTWTVNSSGISLDANKYLTTAMQSNAATISNINVSGGTTSSNLSALQFVNSNGISWGLDTGSKLTATVATNYQPVGAYLTTARASNDAVGLNTAATQVTWTVNSAGISLNAGAYLTTAQPPGAYLTTARASNDAVGLNTAKTNVTWTVNSSGISLDGGGYAGTSTGATNATITLNSAGINISVGAGGAGDGVNVIQLNTNGNTAGATSSQSSGTIYWAGGNNITLSQNSNSITISGANAGGAQTGISGLGGSNTTFSSGTVILSDQANITIGSSVNGGSQYLRFSVGNYLTTAAPSNHSHSLNELLDPSADKVFAMGTRALQFQYGGGGTFSTNATRQAMFEIDAAGNYTDGADVMHVHQSVGNPNVDLVHLQGAGTGVTLLRLDAGASVAAEINAPLKFTGGSTPMILGTSQSNAVANLNADMVDGKHSSDFQSAGAYLTTARASNDAVGLNTAATNVTWTVNSSGISLNAGGYLTTAMQSNAVTLSNINISGGSTSSNLSNFLLVNSNGVSWSLDTGSKVYATVKTDYLTTARGSTDAIGLNTAKTNVTWTVNSSGLSFDAGGYAGTASGFTGANISATITHNTAGLSLNMSVAAPGAAAENNWINLSGNTAGNTTASGSTIKWYGGNNITLHGTNGSEVSIIGGAGGGGAAVGLTTLGNTAGNTKTWTSGTVVFAGSNSLTISQSTDANGGTLFLQPAMSSLAAGALMSLSSNGSTISIINLLSSSGIANDVGSASNAGTLASRFALADHAHAGVIAFGASNTGNTAGNTGTKYGSWVLAGSNNITISGSTGGAGLHTLWVNQTGGGGGGVALGVSNTGHTAGNTGTYSSGTIVLAGSNSLTLSQSSGGAGVHTVWLQPLMSALSGGGGISLSTTGSTIVIYTV